MGARARLLWDAGGLWSVMTWQVCRELGLRLGPVSAAELAGGALSGVRLLVVPGGWPSRKYRALGRDGRRAIRQFVRGGGRYLGLCGGAGLALSVRHGLGLVPLKRLARGQRLPMANGPVRVTAPEAARSHPMWQGLSWPQTFYVWWPGQFADPRPAGLEVLAAYQGPAPGMHSADLAAHRPPPEGWAALEESYGIHLDPARLAGEPAVVRGRAGEGEVVLSYLHFDTPGDPAGARVLRNLWRHWLGAESLRPPPEPPPTGGPAAHLARAAEELWEQGRELGLWRPRHPAMPLWRRGARGLEFWSLVCLCRALVQAGAGPELVQRLEPMMTPLWRRGPEVLAAQAAKLRGGRAQPRAADLQARWFPAPRAVGGEMAAALAALEDTVRLAVAESEGHE